jgi:hypothetical protein
MVIAVTGPALRFLPVESTLGAVAEGRTASLRPLRSDLSITPIAYTHLIST